MAIAFNTGERKYTVIERIELIRCSFLPKICVLALKKAKKVTKHISGMKMQIVFCTCLDNKRCTKRAVS